MLTWWGVEVHETLSFFSNKNQYGFINIYIFAELYLYFNKNNECLINIYSTMETFFDHFKFIRFNFPFLLTTYRKIEYSITTTKYLKSALKQCLLESTTDLICSIFAHFLNYHFPIFYKYILKYRIRVFKRELNCKFTESSCLYNHLKSKLHPNIFS